MSQADRRIEALEKEVRWLRRQLANVPIRVTPGGGGGGGGRPYHVTYDAIKVGLYEELLTPEYASLPAGTIAYVGERDYATVSGIFIKTEGSEDAIDGVWRAVGPVMDESYRNFLAHFGKVSYPAIGYQTTLGRYYVKRGVNRQNWEVMNHYLY